MSKFTPTPLHEIFRRLCATPLEPIPTRVTPRLSKLDGVRAVIFDVYGTLFVSGSGDIGLGATDAREAAMDAAARALGIEIGENGVARFLDEIQSSHARSRAGGVEFPEVEIRDIWRRVVDTDTERLAIEFECRVNPVWPMPGLAETLQALRDRDRVLGIVSNAQFYTPLMIESFSNSSLEELGFDSRRCEWSYERLEAKPSTRLFELLLERLREDGISAGETLYVGNDQRNDIWPAGRSGMRTALFAGDRRSLRTRENDLNCATIAPDLVLTNLAQIADCV